MRRILGFTANDNSLSRHALLSRRDALAASGPSNSESWGIGYEQESQVLVRKRPQAIGGPDLFDLLTDLRTQAFVAFESADADSKLRSENTEPYRFRSWLGVTIGAFEGVTAATMPISELLEQGIGGTTGAERVFFRFLVHLREEGVMLNSPMMRIQIARRAMAATLLDVEAARRASGVEGPIGAAMIFTNGRALLAASLDAELHAARFDGLEVMPPDDLPGRRKRRLRRPTSHDHFKACLVASGLVVEPEGWERIAHGEILSVDESWGIQRGPMEQEL